MSNITIEEIAVNFLVAEAIVVNFMFVVFGVIKFIDRITKVED